jgi:5-hydroxyisourate hydrolase
MGQLTTHVLDVSAGLPAAGIRVELHAVGPSAPLLVASTATGTDGRLALPLLSGPEFRVADYFRGRGVALADPAFIENAVVHIGIAHADQHYHVPLLVAPWSYSVYRGG